MNMNKKVEETFESQLIDDLASGFKKTNSTASASFLWNSTANVKDWISTGNYLLDLILANNEHGGIPAGRLTEISGGEGAGKTLLASYIMAETQRRGGVAIFIDTEHAASMDVLKAVGVDVEKMIHIQAGCVEDVFSAMETIVNKVASSASKNKPITIVWDSVAATSTKAELEGDYDQHTIAMAARIISKGLRKYIPICSMHNVCLVFVNQLRTNIGVTFGDKYSTPGGKAIPYHASVRLRISHFKKILDPATKDLIGRQIKVEVQKNKVAPPMRTTYYTIRWGEKPGAWIDQAASMFDAAITAEIFTKASAQKYAFTYPSTGEKIEFTKKMYSELYEEEAFLSEMKKALAQAYIITAQSISSPDSFVMETADEEEGI